MVSRIRNLERRWAKNFYSKFITLFKSRSVSWVSDGNDAWTRAMMNMLGKMARQYNLVPYSKCHSNGEYLVDMCWVKDTKNKCYIDTAIEEEWNDRNKNEFLKDFYKLSDFKAYLKVFIFAPFARKPSAWVAEFKKIILKNPIKLEKEVYLAIAIQHEQDEVVRVTGYILYNNGNIEYLASKIC